MRGISTRTDGRRAKKREKKGQEKRGVQEKGKRELGAQNKGGNMLGMKGKECVGSEAEREEDGGLRIKDGMMDEGNIKGK